MVVIRVYVLHICTYIQLLPCIPYICTVHVYRHVLYVHTAHTYVRMYVWTCGVIQIYWIEKFHLRIFIHPSALVGLMHCNIYDNMYVCCIDYFLFFVHIFSSPIVPRRGMSDNSAMFWSPSPSRVKRPKEPITSALSGSIPKVHIPAFDVKANYSSDVVKGLGDETTSMDSFTESQLREGKLMISVSVESLEKEVVLTPSLPLFVEQVVQPISYTLDLSSQQNVSVDADSSEDHSDTSSITIAETSSFPIHVFIHFHLKPSTIVLSCEPVSRVHCKIGIPDVHVACSFSLFTVKENDSSLSSESSGLDPQISTLNDLSVTGCLSAFSISVISPQAASSVFQKLQKTGATKGPRFVFSLKLGLASIHLSRKTLVAETNGVVHDKQYISSESTLLCVCECLCFYSLVTPSYVVAADVASVLLGFDIRQLNNATAFRKCWYKKSITESILFGQGSSRSTDEVKSGISDVCIYLCSTGLFLPTFACVHLSCLPGLLLPVSVCTCIHLDCHCVDKILSDSSLIWLCWFVFTIVLTWLPMGVYWLLNICKHSQTDLLLGMTRQTPNQTKLL